MIKGKLLIILGLIFYHFTFPHQIFAQSSYVLPYPSSMPGSSFYKFHLVWEKVNKYWYFGNFGQLDYNLKLSDKYLVEAKTLFEYKQYLLAQESLKKSNNYFILSYRFLGKSKIEGKNISRKQQIFNEASKKHIEVLKLLKTLVPAKFDWIAEKEKPQQLFLWKIIDEGINIREGCK